MTNKKTIIMAAALTAIIAVAGIAASTYAFGGGENGKSGEGFGPMNEEKRQEMETHHEAIREAIANNDYETWKDLMAKCPMADKISDQLTEVNFAKIVEMTNLMQSGDEEGARAIGEELRGLGLPGGMEFRGGPEGRGRGMMNRDFEFKDANGDGVCNRLDMNEPIEE